MLLQTGAGFLSTGQLGEPTTSIVVDNLFWIAAGQKTYSFF
jgi:hypothetical protein